VPARQFVSDRHYADGKSSGLMPALLESAQLELEDRYFDEAIAILDDARLRHPSVLLLDQINLLSAQAQYLAKRFEVATAAFEQIGHSASTWARLALLNASNGRLQMGNQVRFLVEY